MKIFALSDLHLSLSEPFSFERPQAASLQKSMAIFGSCWDHHAARIAAQWQSVVGEEDLVLVAGDISWAMTLDEARYDLDFIGALPGRKLLLRGNHDYWWHGLARIRAALPNNTFVLQNDAFICGELAICGSRLWALPGSGDFHSDDQKIFDRELIRAELSLQDAGEREIIFMSHFPPLADNGEPTAFSELLARYGVKKAIYGHLHGKTHPVPTEGVHHGVEYFLTSCDYLDFTPLLIAQL